LVAFDHSHNVIRFTLKIVVIGAGEVGFDLSRLLSENRHDVTVLDNNKDSLAHVEEKLDVLTIEGNATSIQDLVNCNVQAADIVVAVTSVDEVNMIASMMSKRLGAKKVITRVRNHELSLPESPLKPSDLGIDVLIHPEFSAASEIVQLLKRVAASDVLDLSDGKLQLVGIKLDRDSPLVGKSIQDYSIEMEPIVFRLVAIQRGGMSIIPSGKIRLGKNDQIFILAKTKDISKLVKSTGHRDIKIDRILISGGTTIGGLVAEMLSEQQPDWKIKLVEPDYDRATQLAEQLKNVLILHGNSTDPDLLAQEGIADTDVFIAVSEDEESNIISCLMAKHLGVPKTVALVSKPDYIPLSQTIGLDTAINKKYAAANEIHRYVRKGDLISVATLHGIEAEIIELKAKETSKVINKPVQKLKLPKNCVIGAIIRNDNVEIATGVSVIKPGDNVIVFVFPDAIKEVTSIF